MRIGTRLKNAYNWLLDDYPALSSANVATLDSKIEPPSVSFEILDEYYFLKDILAG
jgi:hypothetical protein